MIRTALVGVSGYGRWHLLMAMEQALLGRLKLVGVTVINRGEQEALCQRLERKGVRVFGHYEAMMAALAGEVDLVMIPTGMHWHASMTLTALAGGAHVLVEKPLAPTLVEADAIIAAQAATGRLVAVGYQDLYVPLALDLKRRVLEGEIGRLKRIVVRGQWPRTAGYFQRNGWAGRLQVDGRWVLDSPVANAYAHFLMLALFWAGPAADEAATVETIDAELYRAAAIESFDTCCLRAITSGGVEVVFYGTHAGAEDRAPEVGLSGDRGTISWQYEGTCTVRRAGASDEVLRVPDQLETRLCVLDAVLDRLEGRDRFVVGPQLARVHTRVMNALHEYFPVTPIAAADLERSGEGAGAAVRIRNVDATIAAAAKSGLLFSEAGAPWAAAGEGPRTLRGYEAFGGCREGPGPALIARRPVRGQNGTEPTPD